MQGQVTCETLIVFQRNNNAHLANSNAPYIQTIDAPWRATSQYNHSPVGTLSAMRTTHLVSSCSYVYFSHHVCKIAAEST
jgi:hypothetical protein